MMTILEFVFVLAFYGFLRGALAACLGKEVTLSPFIAFPEELGKIAMKHWGWAKDESETEEVDEPTLLVEDDAA